MTFSMLLAVGFLMKSVSVLFMVCSVVLALVILIQKGKGGGLSGAFGGGMASGLLGSKTGDFLTWVTIGLVGVFLLLAVLMAKFYKPSIIDTVAEQTAQQSQTQNTEPQIPSGDQPADSTDKPAETNSPVG